MKLSEKISAPGSGAGAEIDLVFLSRLFTVFWHNKLLFAACGVGAIVAAATWMHIAPPTYQSEMALLPNPNDSPSNTSKTSSLSSLLDLGFGSGDAPNFVKFVDTLTSYRLAERLQDRHRYLQRVFPNRWNEVSGNWAPPNKVIYVSRLIFLGRQTKAPNITSLQDYIRSHMTVDEDKKNHSLLIKFRSLDPVLAVDLLNDIQQEADGLLREDSRDYTQHAISYLESSLTGITAVDHRRALTSLLIDYERTLILVSDNNQAFATIVVDPPTLTSVPVSPKASLVYPAFLVVAGLIATGVASLRSRSRRVHDE